MQKYKTEFKLNSNILLVLAVLQVIFCLAADVVGNRFTTYDNLMWSGATILFPLTSLISNIIAESYGYNMAKIVIWLTLIGELIFSLLIYAVNLTPTSSLPQTQNAYNIVINPIVRFVIAGIITNIASDFLNIYLLSKSKILTKGRFFWIRCTLSTAISEFLSVIIMIFLAFWGTGVNDKIFEILLSTYGLEMLYALILVLPAAMLVSLIKKAEGIDVYDYGLNYNPFNIMSKKSKESYEAQ